MEGPMSKVSTPPYESVSQPVPQVVAEPYFMPRQGVGGLMGLVIAGVVMLLVGAIVLQVRIVIEQSGSDYQSYYRMMRWLTFGGEIILSVGVILILVAGFVAGLFRTDLPEGIRRTMIIATTVLTSMWLVVFFWFAGLLGGGGFP